MYAMCVLHVMHVGTVREMSMCKYVSVYVSMYVRMRVCMSYVGTYGVLASNMLRHDVVFSVVLCIFFFKIIFSICT